MLRIVSLLFVLLVCASCATPKVSVSPSLHRFQAVDSVTDGHALLYIYYPYTEVAHNSIYNTSVSVALHVSGKKVIQLPNKGYTWIELKPGQYRIEAEWTRAQGVVSPRPVAVGIEVAAGNTYYLRLNHTGKASLGPTVGGMVVGLPQTIMEDITAQFKLETNFNDTGLPWCNYSKPDIIKLSM